MPTYSAARKNKKIFGNKTCYRQREMQAEGPAPNYNFSVYLNRILSGLTTGIFIISIILLLIASVKKQSVSKVKPL